MKCIRPIVFSLALLLAVGAFAIQSSTVPSGQSSSQDPAQQNPPAQPPAGQQPSQPPAGQQPSQPPAAQQPSQPPGAQPMRPPTIDEQVATLTQELTLNQDQQGKVKTILEDQHAQAMTVVNDSALPREEKVQKIHTIRESTISKVRGLLNDDQKKKLDEMLQEPNVPPHAQPQGNPPPPK